jgi:hypothetical protein
LACSNGVEQHQRIIGRDDFDECLKLVFLDRFLLDLVEHLEQVGKRRAAALSEDWADDRLGRSSSRVLKEQKELIGEKIDYLNKLRGMAETAKVGREKPKETNFYTFCSILLDCLREEYGDVAAWEEGKGFRVGCL